MESRQDKPTKVYTSTMVSRVFRRSTMSNATLSGSEEPQQTQSQSQSQSQSRVPFRMMRRRNSTSMQALQKDDKINDSSSKRSNNSEASSSIPDNSLTDHSSSELGSQEFTASDPLPKARHSAPAVVNRRAMMPISRTFDAGKRQGSFRNLMKFGSGGSKGNVAQEDEQQEAAAAPATINMNTASRRDMFQRSKSIGGRSGSFRNLMMGGGNKTNDQEEDDSNANATFNATNKRRGSMRRGSLRNISRSLSMGLGVGGGSSEFVEEQPKKEFLLDTLGGMAVLGSLVKDFEVRVRDDERLQPFFQGVDYHLVAAHQRRLFAMAFTEIPTSGNDAEKMADTIRMSHARLFSSMAFSDLHFDMIVQHLADALKARRFNVTIIDQVTSTLAPLRNVFEEEAEKYNDDDEDESYSDDEDEEDYSSSSHY